MQTFVPKLIALAHDNEWLMEVAVTLIVTLVTYLIWGYISYLLTKAASKTKQVWDDVLFDALSVPVGVLIWIIGFTSCLDSLSDAYDRVNIFQRSDDIQAVLIVLVISWFMMRFIRKAQQAVVQKTVFKKKQIDATTAQAVAQGLRVLVILGAVLALMQSLGFAISGLLAFGGASTVVIGLAGRDILANFFGGFMIYLDKPFKVGDWVRSPDREIEGTVEYIGWRLCRIRTFDKRPLYVPNSVFSTICLENPSRMQNRRIRAVVSVRYDDADKVRDIVTEVEAMLKNHPGIDTKQTLFVHLVAMAASSLDFLIYTFTKTTNWVEFQRIQEDVLLQVMQIITKHGAECAFPTSTVHIPEQISIQQ